jgi:ferredoxin
MEKHHRYAGGGPHTRRCTTPSEPTTLAARSAREGVAMRVIVDIDRCDSNGLCTEIAPELFRLDESDDLQVLVEYPAESDWGLAEKAARGCPKLAITLLEET